MRKSKKKRKIWRWLVLVLIVFFVVRYIHKPIVLHQRIEIVEWWNFYDFVKALDRPDVLRLKIYLKLHPPLVRELSHVAQGWYVFSWSYSFQSFVDVIRSWPSKEYFSYTVLEWWSIYDIDRDLTQKWLIKEGDYLALVMNQTTIDKYRKLYAFIPQKHLLSLEWFLYPDTYFLDKNQWILDQLLKLQLANFNTKIWNRYSGEMNNFYKGVQSDYHLDFSWYDTIILASVVEKEERNPVNKPIVAGIFLNRLQDGMRLDADITLCYGLKESYTTCTPAVIRKGIYDENNVFNTRKRTGLPPQAIANISSETFDAIVHYKNTHYYYYLHDSSGGIHYGKTVKEHNSNKAKYLR